MTQNEAKAVIILETKRKEKMIQRNMLMAIKIALVAEAIFAGNAAYGQYSKSGSKKSLTSFCGFKRGEEKKKSSRDIRSVKVQSSFRKYMDVKVIKARSPFRKFRDVDLGYSEKGRLYYVFSSVVLKCSPTAFKKEMVGCCKELERQGVTFEDWNELKGGNWLERRGYEENAHAEVEINACVSERRMSINVRWYAVDEVPVDVDAALKALKSNGDIRTFIETLAGEKFGSPIPENPLDAAKKTQLQSCYSYFKEWLLSKPLWDVQHRGVWVWFGKETKRLNGILLSRRVDMKKHKWSDIRADFEKLHKQVETTLGITLSNLNETDGKYVSCEAEKDDLLVQVCVRVRRGEDDYFSPYYTLNVSFSDRREQ